MKVLSEADRKPIGGARVRLVGWTLIDSDHFADNTGSVEIYVDFQEGLPSPPETCYLQIGAKDFAAELKTVDLGAVQPAELEVTLKPGGSIQGRGQDESRRPLPGVGIYVYGSDQGGEPLDYVETDAEGHYRLDYLPLNQALQLHLKKMDYLEERKEFHADAGNGQQARLDFVLKKRPHGGSVRGVVTDAQGKQIAGAEVLNRGDDPDFMRSCITDARGAFILHNVFSHENRHRLLVQAKGFAAGMVEFKPGSAMEPATVAMKLELGHRLEGRLVNAAGKPIPRADVYSDGTEGSWYSCEATTTDADGRFHFDSLPAKSVFRFMKEGFEPIGGMELPRDGAKEVVVTMEAVAQSVIKGRVIDARTGKPLPRFTLRITPSLDARPDEPAYYSSELGQGRAFASLQGQFVLKGLNAGTPLQVRVSAEGYRRQIVRRVVAKSASEAEPVEIRMTAEDPARLVTVRGRLVNYRGQPVGGAVLHLIVTSDQPEPGDPGWFDWNTIEIDQLMNAPNVLQVQSRTTAADGSFVFQRLPGNAEIELVYWGKSVPPGRLDHLEKLSEKKRTALLIQAPAPARILATIDRTVFPKIAFIQMSGVPQFYRPMLSADGKSFVMDGLPAGTYRLEIYSPEKPVQGPGDFSGLGGKSVTLEAGKEIRISLGEADRAKDGSH